MENRKVFLNEHTNLLELEEHMYPLVDVDTPNVFRNLFRYDEIPKIAFNDRIVPHHMPDEIWTGSVTNCWREPLSSCQIPKRAPAFAQGSPRWSSRRKPS